MVSLTIEEDIVGFEKNSDCFSSQQYTFYVLEQVL